MLDLAPLPAAAASGDVAAVRARLAAGDAADSADSSGVTALYAACQNGHGSLVALLLQSHAIPDCSIGRGGITPLLIACSNGHAACVHALLDGGASANKPDADGFTPLYISSGKGHSGCVESLLAHGADTEQAEDKGVTVRPAVRASALPRASRTRLRQPAPP